MKIAIRKLFVAVALIAIALGLHQRAETNVESFRKTLAENPAELIPFDYSLIPEKDTSIGAVRDDSTFVDYLCFQRRFLVKCSFKLESTGFAGSIRADQKAVVSIFGTSMISNHPGRYLKQNYKLNSPQKHKQQPTSSNTEPNGDALNGSDKPTKRLRDLINLTPKSSL